MDPKSRTVQCRDDSEVVAEGAQQFTLPYDRLVVAVGAPCNTFGTPGVREHTTFLKEIQDALVIRWGCKFDQRWEGSTTVARTVVWRNSVV